MKSASQAATLRAGLRFYALSPIERGISYYVLRTTYGGVDNDAEAFLAAKLFPGPAGQRITEAGCADMRPTAARHDVLPPDNASEALLYPKRLIREHVCQLDSGLQALLCCINIRLPDNMQQVRAWELVRSFAHRLVVAEQQLPAVLILHNP